MPPLTEPRNTVARSGDRRAFKVKGRVRLFQGAMVAINNAGLAVPMSTAKGLQGVGRAERTVDNREGLDGELTVEVGSGIYRFANSAGKDEIGQQHIGDPCFGVDDQTVALTNDGNKRSVAGTIHDVDEQGVWVKFS